MAFQPHDLLALSKAQSHDAAQQEAADSDVKKEEVKDELKKEEKLEVKTEVKEEEEDEARDGDTCDCCTRLGSMFAALSVAHAHDHFVACAAALGRRWCAQ